MAHIETRYRCPICNNAFDKYIEAVRCRNKHDIISERWAVGRYKDVRIFDNCAPDGRGGVNWALKEADLSDDIDVRKQQLEELRKLKEDKHD